jgi:signal transduction histidine kinase
MQGWGSWYALAGAVLVIGCYACGRRGLNWTVFAVLGAVEVAAQVAVAVQHDVLYWLLNQLVVVFAVFVALAGSYRRLRHELTVRGWSHARDAQLRERARIAADIHDTLGHDLTLLSLQAAGIQVTATEPEVQERAAQLRAGAAAAITTVKRLVDLLDVESGSDVTTVLERARAAGMTVDVSGLVPPAAFAARLVSEALANAATHAPGEAVSVAFAPDGRFEISNRLVHAAAPDTREGTGLAALRARVWQAGGTLHAGAVDGFFRVTGQIPADIDARAPRGSESLAADYDSRRRRARRVFALAALAPLAALVLLTTGFYTWAGHDATIEPDTYGQLHVGMSEAAALGLLPPRQSPLRFTSPHAADCRFYSNGNYPLAYGNYEICFSDGRVSWLSDHTGDSQ